MNTEGLLEPGDVIQLGKFTFVVDHTAFDGGGTGHGPHDIYPDGHHVYCLPLPDDQPGARPVDFWQTGCFTRMRPAGTVVPIGKARKTWSML